MTPSNFILEQPAVTSSLLIPIVVPVGILSMIILTFSFMVLYKRKKLYGGFYLFSYPPLLDITEMIDENENFHEVIERLPFILEWEFPRERIKFGEYIGLTWLRWMNKWRFLREPLQSHPSTLVYDDYLYFFPKLTFLLSHVIQLSQIPTVSSFKVFNQFISFTWWY